MRRFVADASHELRTPLTSIRGFAELYRQGAAAARGRRARGSCSASRTRPSAWACSSRTCCCSPGWTSSVRWPATPVDLLALAADAVHDARAIDPERPITLDGRRDRPAAGRARRRRPAAPGAGQPAHERAAPHAAGHRRSPSGGHRAGRRRALLEVADQGPGMDRRGRGARLRALLPRRHVPRPRATAAPGWAWRSSSALVAGHGGTVDVDTAPGRRRAPSGCGCRWPRAGRASRAD